MPRTATARLGLIGFDGSVDLINQGDDMLNAILDRLDAILAPVDHGLFSARPTSTTGTPGIVDRRYYATDIGLWFRDTGTGWTPDGIPLGGYLPWAGDNDLTPELVRADGRLIDKTVYSGFFTAFGHRFNGGVDPGSNHVKIPDVLGRGVIGAGTGSGLSARTVGQLVGEEAHLLTAAESGLPDHTHHYDRATSSGANQSPASPGFGVIDSSPSTATTGVDGGAKNASNAHNTMQPSAVATILVRII